MCPWACYRRSGSQGAAAIVETRPFCAALSDGRGWKCWFPGFLQEVAARRSPGRGSARGNRAFSPGDINLAQRAARHNNAVLKIGSEPRYPLAGRLAGPDKQRRTRPRGGGGGGGGDDVTHRK